MTRQEIVFIEGNRRGATTHAMRLAHEWGYDTRLLTRHPAYYGDGPDSPTKVADAVNIVDTFDATRILYSVNWGRTSAILAFNDYHIVPAALAAQAIGLPHASVAGLINTRFKDRTRQSLADCPGNPGFDVLNLEQNDLQFLPSCGFPCVVKPIDDSGSHGVYICKDAEGLVRAIANIQKRTVNARGYNLTRCYVIEEYIEGPEFSAELFWDARKQDWVLLGFTRKTVTPPPLAFELGHVFPHSFSSELASHVEGRIRQWLSTVKLRGFAAHVEFRLTSENEPFCIEINPRLGGDKIDTLIGLALGVDPVAWYLKLHLGEPIELPTSLPASKQVAGICFLLPEKVGYVTDITLTTATDIEEVDLTRTLPKTVAGDGRMTDRIGHVIVVGRDAEEVINKLDEAMNKICIHYDPSN